MKDLDISNIESKPIVAKPKRRYPNRVVKSKYDKVVFELKMAQTALDNRNKDVDGWVKKINELVAERDAAIAQRGAVIDEMTRLNAIITEREAERDRLKAQNVELKDERDQARMHYERVNEMLTREVEDSERLKAKVEELRKQRDATALNVNLQNAVITTKSAEHARLDTLAKKLYYQRNNAIYWAVGLGLVAFGFAVAVWIGRLVPVI